MIATAACPRSVRPLAPVGWADQNRPPVGGPRPALRRALTRERKRMHLALLDDTQLEIALERRVRYRVPVAHQVFLAGLTIS